MACPFRVSKSLWPRFFPAVTMHLEDFIHATNAAPDPESLSRLFMGTLDNLGFDRVVYSFMTDSPLLKKKKEHGVVRNYPEDWMKHYAEKNYLAIDPVYRTALVTRRPFSWKELMQKNLTDKQRYFMNEAEEAGLKDGVALSIHGPMGETIGVGLASSHGGADVSKDMLSRIYLLVHQFHLCYSDFLGVDCPIPPETDCVLSRREKEVLIWCAHGKSNAIIAGFLGITDSAVDFHLGNVYRKLGTSNKLMAVLKAFHLGLISI
jgi:DNA-binding CsgD family transcriptional regulator